MQTALTTHHESEVKHLQEQLAEAQDRIQKQQLENQKVRKFLDLPKNGVVKWLQPTFEHLQQPRRMFNIVTFLCHTLPMSKVYQ